MEDRNKMAKDNIIEKLRSGEKVECPECHKGKIVPFNSSYDRALFFDCSNEECNFHINIDKVIDVE